MNGNSTDGLKFPVPHVPPFFNYNSMGRLGRNKEEKQRAKQEREHQYRLNSEAKAKKKKEIEFIEKEKKSKHDRLGIKSVLLCTENRVSRAYTENVLTE